MSAESYDFLYDYAKAALDEELARFERLETKASRLGSLLVAAIAVFSAALRFAPIEYVPAKGAIDWVILILAGLTYLALVSAWSQVVGSLKIVYSPRMPLNPSIIDMVRKEDTRASKWSLARTCNNALNVSREVIKDKADALEIAYRDIIFAGWTLSLTFLAMFTKAAVFV